MRRLLSLYSGIIAGCGFRSGVESLEGPQKRLRAIAFYDFDRPGANDYFVYNVRCAFVACFSFLVAMLKLLYGAARGVNCLIRN